MVLLPLEQYFQKLSFNCLTSIDLCLACSSTNFSSVLLAWDSFLNFGCSFVKSHFVLRETMVWLNQPKSLASVTKLPLIEFLCRCFGLMGVSDKLFADSRSWCSQLIEWCQFQYYLFEEGIILIDLVWVIAKSLASSDLLTICSRVQRFSCYHWAVSMSSHRFSQCCLSWYEWD